MRIKVSKTSTPLANNSFSSQNRSILRTKRRSSTTYESEVKKRKRRKPGQVAIKQIAFYQKTANLLLPKLSFQRIVREIVQSVTPDEYKWSPNALEALQTSTEAYLTAVFEDTNKAAIHGKRVTIRPEDMHFIRDIRTHTNPQERL